MLIIGIILVLTAVIIETWTLEKLRQKSCEDKFKKFELERVTAFSFGLFHLLGGVGVCLILIHFLGFNPEFKWAFPAFILVPAIFSFIEGFTYKKKQ